MGAGTGVSITAGLIFCLARILFGASVFVEIIIGFSSTLAGFVGVGVGVGVGAGAGVGAGETGKTVSEITRPLLPLLIWAGGISISGSGILFSSPKYKTTFSPPDKIFESIPTLGLSPFTLYCQLSHNGDEETLMHFK